MHYNEQRECDWRCEAYAPEPIIATVEPVELTLLESEYPDLVAIYTQAKTQPKNGETK